MGSREVVPFKDRKIKLTDDYAWTDMCNECGEIYIYPEDFVSIDGKIVCGNCARKYGVTI